MVGPDIAAFIQQQVQAVFQTAVPHIIQQINERTAQLHISPPTQEQVNPQTEGGNSDRKDSKVARPDKFAGKKGNEVYKWLAQIRLVFRSQPRAYHTEEDKISYALSYMTGSAQNWAMPILQALDEGRPHPLLHTYDEFREAVIAVFGDIDRRGNAEDKLDRIRQTGGVATYISMFSEYSALVDWNDASLVARFRRGLKDEILDSIATAETQPRTLQEWMAMSSRIDERLWARRQGRRQSSGLQRTQPALLPRPQGRLYQPSPLPSGPTPMDLDAVGSAPAFARTAAQRSEFQRLGKCWGCGQIGHIRSRCPVNPSRRLSISALEENTTTSGKEWARD